MSVIEITELHQQRRSSYSDKKMKHQRAFMVRCDDPKDGTFTAIYATALSFTTLDEPRFEALTHEQFINLVNNTIIEIPLPMGAYPEHVACRVVSVEAEPVKDSDLVFLVTVGYESLGDESLTLPPLDRPPVFTYSANETTAPYFLDESEPRLPLTNTAGDPFENTSEREAATLIITMVRNEEAFDVNDAYDFANTTNKFAVTLDGTTYPPDRLKLGMPSAQQRTEYIGNAQFDYYEVTRTFKASREGWRDDLLSYGYNELTWVPGPSGSPILSRLPILDGAGMKTSRPWPLDAEGHALPTPSGTPAVVTRRPYRSIDWSSLELE